MNNNQTIQEMVLQGGEREIMNVVSFLNFRKVGRIMNTKAENLPQLIFSAINFNVNNLSHTFQEALNLNYCQILKQNWEVVF